jgi:hypothetical protein
MVAVIKTGHSLNRILTYNENKVNEGKAECISAANYPIDTEKISFNQKLNRLLKQASLNENVSCNSVHISLNFDPSEKLTNEQLKEISDSYMQKIGFGEQPYLVYQHFDAGHPHLHIVSVKVRADSTRIDTNNIGRNQSEKARKEIEQMYGLIKAEDSKQRQAYQLKPVNVQKVQYGRSETKRAITNVLDAIVNSYKYTSLPELNSVLQQFNIIADKGNENSRVFQNKGLVYRIIDENGSKVGVPIKASDFYNNPGLKYLVSKFALNEAARQSHKGRVKNVIDLALLKNKNYSVQDLIKVLEKDGINMILRRNDTGLIYGLTYVDHRTKCVFNGSDLGKQYSAKGIQERCNQSDQPEHNQVLQTQHSTKSQEQRNLLSINQETSSTDVLTTSNLIRAVDDLLQPAQVANYVPHQLKKRKKKKRKSISSNS